MSHDSDAPRLLGRSPVFAEVRRVLERACHVSAPVLLEGETGTGKTLTARWIHGRSSRSGGPFVAVNCAGIPDSLFESELFGHRKGAFTGAVDDRPGLFEAASGGTLFLDEVAELPGLQQGKLLTVLDEGEVRRVGDVRTRSTDVRVVSATARDVDSMVRSGAFRSDLFHRLALLRVALPPLRERSGDLELLAGEILETCGRRHLGVAACLTPAALDRLRAHLWPGNVRELAHVLEAALILSGRRRLDRKHVEWALRGTAIGGGREAGGASAAAAVNGGVDASTDGGRDASTVGGRNRPTGAIGGEGEAPPDGDGRPRRRYSFYGTDEEEKRRIRTCLRRFDGNRTRTARALGMSRATLRARIRKYDLE